MRRAIWFVIGCGLGFLVVLAGCIALGLTALGVGGGLLVRWDPNAQENLNYDPSRVASFAPIAAGSALVLFGIVIALAIWLSKKKAPQSDDRGASSEVLRG